MVEVEDPSRDVGYMLARSGLSLCRTALRNSDCMESWIELIPPIPDIESQVRSDVEINGEDVKGIVFAVNEAMENRKDLGLGSY